MRRCFDPNLSILVIGTDPAEWVDGYAGAEHFIAHDWSSWGDARLDLSDAEISSADNTAWVATIGVVNLSGTKHTFRFTAVLSQNSDHWVLREMQYQYNERPLQVANLLSPLTLAQVHTR
jgi:hypothetical protein